MQDSWPSPASSYPSAFWNQHPSSEGLFGPPSSPSPHILLFSSIRARQTSMDPKEAFNADTSLLHRISMERKIRSFGAYGSSICLRPVPYLLPSSAELHGPSLPITSPFCKPRFVPPFFGLPPLPPGLRRLTNEPPVRVELTPLT
ncbi:hypothetical protein NMY22_g18697 [Coprinellus aureogranulatus]|nr:hypothetical protein NMY22_g18697 [Coprinellus aureogranulatus]